MAVAFLAFLSSFSVELLRIHFGYVGCFSKDSHDPSPVAVMIYWLDQ
jgi:hypothetical protein